jgi:hypothetical protein
MVPPRSHTHIRQARTRAFLAKPVTTVKQPYGQHSQEDSNMIMVALSCPPSEDPVAAVVRTVASHLADGLTERPPEGILDPFCASAPALRQADLLIVAAAVPLDATCSSLLDVLEEGVLAGCVVFLAAIGSWPAEAGTVDRALLPAVRRAGGLCMAPTLHVVDAAPAPIDTYCRYWRPITRTLLQRRTSRTAAA